MTILEGRKVSLTMCGDFSLCDPLIEVSEKVLGAVRIAFRMPARVVRVRFGLWVQQRGIFHQKFVGAVPISQPHLFGLFLVPDNGVMRTIDLEIEPVLSAGADLRNCKDTAGAIIKP